MSEWLREFDMSKISAFKGLSKELPLKILPFFILKKMIGWKVKVTNEVLKMESGRKTD